MIFRSLSIPCIQLVQENRVTVNYKLNVIVNKLVSTSFAHFGNPSIMNPPTSFEHQMSLLRKKINKFEKKNKGQFGKKKETHFNRKDEMDEICRQIEEIKRSNAEQRQSEEAERIAKRKIKHDNFIQSLKEYLTQLESQKVEKEKLGMSTLKEERKISELSEELEKALKE